MKREELAWAAGFFDGEGHTGRGTHGGRRPIIAITQVDRRPLDRFAEAVGVGKVYGPYLRVKGNRQPVFLFQTSTFQSTQAVVAKLWTFLSRPKQEQAAAVLRSYNTERGWERPALTYFKSRP